MVYLRARRCGLSVCMKYLFDFGGNRGSEIGEICRVHSLIGICVLPIKNTSCVPVFTNMKCWDAMWNYLSHRSRITSYCVVVSPHHCKFRSVSTLKYRLDASSAASHTCTRKRYVSRLTLSVPLRPVKLFSCVPCVANSRWLSAKEPHTAA
jgi:hypothetical protein